MLGRVSVIIAASGLERKNSEFCMLKQLEGLM